MSAMIFKSEPACTTCPDCGAHDAVYETVPLGAINSTQRYHCPSCYFVAWGADAWRANGIATDAQVPTTWRESARKYTAKMRARS